MRRAVRIVNPATADRLMGMHRNEKEAVVDELQRKLGHASAFYLTDFTGLNVKQITQFRARLRKQGVEYVVVKNTLAKRAIEGLELPNVAGFFSGPTGLVIGREDAVAAAKALSDFAREFGDRPAVKVGVVDRQEFAPDQVKRLADMPPREVLLSQVSFGLRAPLQRLLGGMSEVLAHAARAFALLQERRERESALPTTPSVSLSQAATASVGATATTVVQAIAVPAEVVLTPREEASVSSAPQEIDQMIVEELNEVEGWTLGVALRERENSAEPLRVNAPYTLSLAFGPSDPVSAGRARPRRRGRTRLSIRSTLMLVSRNVELLPDGPGAFRLQAQTTAAGSLWRAAATVDLSADGPLKLPELTIIPRSSSNSELSVLLLVGDQVYRDWVLHLHVPQ